MQRTHLPSRRGRAAVEPRPATRIAFVAPVDGEAAADETDADRAAPRPAPDRQPTASATRSTAGVRPRHPHAAARRSTSQSGAVRQLTDADEHVGEPVVGAGRRLHRLHRQARGVDDLDLRIAVHVIDPADAAAPARDRRVRRRVSPATVAFAPDGRHLVVVGWDGEPEGIARLYRVDLATGEARELAASLDRNVMPGAPAYPGALPQFTADRRRALRHPRPRLHAPLRRRRSTAASRGCVHGGDGNVVSGLSVAGSHGRDRPVDATSFGEIVLLDLAAGDATPS